MSFPKIDGYVVTERLGSGSYSTVFKAYNKVGARSSVAIKCVDKSRLKQSGAAIDNLITEIRLLKTLRHPHIVHMHNFTWDHKNIYIITEYCCGGDLSRYIHRCGRIPEKQVVYFLQQLASALKFLREKGVAHMDLKPHNLLLNKSGNTKYTLKVADFGFAQYMSEDCRRNSIRGSPLYMAPEMLLSDGPNASYDARVDLWSVGTIMYECLFGRAPYSSQTFKELMEKVTNRQPIQIPKMSSISEGCQDLLTRLLQHDPASRITYEEFFSHEYLDLEHMPSKENYDKAVSLIKSAVELDSKNNLESAFQAYCHSLRYLVPIVNAEGDSVRRAALRAKVLKYMERAEELKQLLKCTEEGPSSSSTTAPNKTVTVQTFKSCCSNVQSTHFDENCMNNCGNPHPSDVDTGQYDKIQEYQGVTVTESKEVGNGKDEKKSGGGKSNWRRRLFGKCNEIPQLDDYDEKGEESASRQNAVPPLGETSSQDACRIT